MSRSILVEAGARKGGAPRALKKAVDASLDDAREAAAPAAMIRAMETAKVAANKLISVAPGGSVVQVRIAVQEDAFGDWNVSLLVDVTSAEGG